MKPVRSSRIRRERFAIAALLRRLHAITKEPLTESERALLLDQALSEAGTAGRFITIIDVPSNGSGSGRRWGFHVDKEALSAVEIGEDDVSAVA